MRNAYEALEDKALLSLLNTSDEEAYTEIYNRYWKKIFFIAANKLHNLSEAEELVQDIFLDLWKRRNTLQITGSLGAYLAVAVKYRVINSLACKNQQKQFIQHTLSIDNGIDRSTEQWLSFEDLREELEHIVSSLPEKCRLVYRLSREEGLTQKEISGILGIAVKTVEAHIGKALQSLRAGLSNFIFLFPLFC